MNSEQMDCVYYKEQRKLEGLLWVYMENALIRQIKFQISG